MGVLDGFAKNKKSTLADLAQKRREETKKMLELNNKISDDLGIIVSSNVSIGELFYRCGVTGLEYNFDESLNVLTFGQLKYMMRSQRKFLSEYWIVPIGIVDETDFELKDILKALNLDKIYEGNMELTLTEGFLDALILDSDLDMLENALETLDVKYLKILVERAVYLFREKKLYDSSKMDLVKEITGNEYLFDRKDLGKKEKRKIIL